MEWKYSDNKQKLNLFSDDLIISQIDIKNKPNNKINKFIVKVLLNNLVVGKLKTLKMKKKNHSWFVLSKRKFKNELEMNSYLKTKQKIVENYILKLDII